MPWFKVDDTFPHHAKVLEAGNAAVGLWTRAGAWSMQQLTDGFIPNHVARTLGTPGEAKRLVSAGLWLPVEGGYRFHQWDERQPSREKVETERHAATERQRKAREAAKSRRDSRSDTSVSHGPPDPTRPDPTQEEAHPPDGTAAGKPPTRTKKGIPDDFRPNDAHLDLASSLGIDLRAEWPQFVDHHKSRGSTMKDWDAALRTWIRNAKKFGGGKVLAVVNDPSELPPVETSWMERR